MEPSLTQPGASAALPLEPVADVRWRLVEEGLTPAREPEVESVFAVANGYVGTRGSLAERCALSRPATFAAGAFESEPERAWGRELVVLPDWTHLRVLIGGSALTLEDGEVLEHRRILDLRQAACWREWRHRDAAGRITRLVFLRLASRADRHLLFQSVTITPENWSGTLRVESGVEAPRRLSRHDVEAPPWIPVPDTVATLQHTTRPGVTVAVGLVTEARAATGARGEGLVEAGAIVERWEVEVSAGEPARLDRVAAVHTSRDAEHPAAACRARLERVRRAPGDWPERLLRDHVAAWASAWRAADVEVDGDDAAQEAMRFAVYHLMSAAHAEDGRVSVAARGLTGHAYQGHVFWDTEMYLVPFYIWIDPRVARALLAYRHHTLPAARRKARGLGYRGALYAWESADTGDETTPPALVSPHGEVLRVLTGEQEHHVSADVAHAVWEYWQTTGDDEFLLAAGAEILVETARFWASRAELEADGRAHIRQVIGPDEHHEGVDDNAFTNVMARANLERAAAVARTLIERWPGRWRSLVDAFDITVGEPAGWERLAEALETGFDPASGLFEQFHGFFTLEDVDPAGHGECGIPIDVCLGRERIRRSKAIKQADVVALSAFLWDRFPPETHAANFRYYEPRCAHGSSLSMALHALVAARLGRVDIAERYFRWTAEVDLADRMGNTAGGVHIGALGGLWQTAVLGFAGTRRTERGLAFDPHLPAAWKRLRFTAAWRRRRAFVTVQREPPGVEVALEGEAPMAVAIVGGPEAPIAPGERWRTRHGRAGWEPWNPASPEQPTSNP